MKPPIRFRNDIPFFYDKSEAEFQKDSYERFDSMVYRQTALHLADEIWGCYPLQSVLDFLEPNLSQLSEVKTSILEIGCSTGRKIAELAKRFPKSNCWGLDYSYQMLRRADEYWVKGETVYLDFRNQGFPNILELKPEAFPNLKFGLAKASELPFEKDSQDFIFHSFLLDRVEAPNKALQEMYRVLASNGKMVFVTPLNFLKAKHWELYSPPVKIYQLLLDLGFKILDWQDDFLVREPIDLRGNGMEWKCLGVVCGK